LSGPERFLQRLGCRRRGITVAQGFKGSLKRIHAGAHLARPDISADQVAQSGTHRSADRASGQADQRAEDREYRREHVASPRKLRT